MPVTTPPDRVTALGRLNPAAGVIPIYGPPGDRILKFYPTKDGQPIAIDAGKTGDLGEIKFKPPQ